MNNQRLLYTLHGYLGRPSDWTSISFGNSAYSYDLFSTSEILKPFHWARNFNTQIQKNSPHSSHILMGYSLGGRLALHALIDSPSLWAGAIIISSHPGLKSEEDKAKRLIHDEQWAKRFENDPWDLLMHDWNSQSVFKGSQAVLARSENEFSRPVLAKAMRQWSLGNQENLSIPVQSLPMPLLWITGSLDSIYTNLSKSIKLFNGYSEKASIPDAGHRVPWDQPEKFKTTVTQFLRNIR